MTAKRHEVMDLHGTNLDDAKFSDEKVVISGMAGMYPDSYNVKELSEILYNKVNPIRKTNRWEYNHPEVAQYNGNIPDISSFDAQFFKVHYRLSNNMDIMARKILEQAFQAIYDAGVSPEHLSGKKVGVYIGSCFSETEKACFYVARSRTGFGIAGCSKTMFANRISYWLNAKGPSMSIDGACCSSTAALELAYLAISRGDCESAIVGGANLCLHPQSSVHYGRVMKLSTDGKTKSFDDNAVGCAKSEAINVLFLQKAKDALRAYAEIVYAKTEFTSLIKTETGPKYGFYRHPRDIVKFLTTFYKEAKISPQAIQYVEAFGSGVPEADKSELEAIDDVFCKSRNKPLLVGSVMSNIGYGEAASGISAVTKVLLGYHHGKLAGNLNCESPRKDVSALKEGRIKILQEQREFDCTYAAVNSLSITGTNAHVLLKGRCKPKDINRYKTNIPRIVLLSARQESAVKKIIDDLKSRPIDPEEHALFHNIHETRISGHLGRGFVILDTNDKNETISLCEESDYFDQGKRPLWFVYSGMGSQWVGMGKELMRIPIFAAAIERCHRVLEPKGVNIVDIITSDDTKIFNNILHSFVGITAIQIGLTDVLRELDIFPDNIMGHSLGEIACAYADGCFTAEETILCSYSRGLVSIETTFIRGSMAAVGLGYQEISKLCPPEIEVACHNSSESSTISGPAEIMSEFVASLVNKKIFAKEVPCSNIAYHSRYIAKAGPALLSYMKELIPSPKPRSERWISTSVPQDRWDEPIAKYSSAEYHTNNLLNSVLFEEASTLIPSDAVLIEIAPHGLLQAILKRSLPRSCLLLPLTRRAHPDNVQFLLEALGRLSMGGFNPKVKALYPKVEFPVSPSTPMLSHLVEWAHNEKWHIALYANANRKTAAASENVISTYDDEHSYLRGHVIGGKNLYPFAAALVLVWDTFAMSFNSKPKSLSVEFRDVFLYSQPVLHEQRQLRINVAIHRGSGRFEVLNGNSLVVRGFIFNKNEEEKYTGEPRPRQMHLNSQDIYKLLHARDHQYMNDFRSIHSVNDILTEAEIKWKNNWITFLDGILQLNILRRKHNSISKLNSIRKLIIDVEKQLATEIITKDNIPLYVANVFQTFDNTVCGGVVIENIKFIDLPVPEGDCIAFKTPRFIPFFSTNTTIDMKNALSVYLQIVADNIKKEKMNILEIFYAGNDKSEFYDFKNIISFTPGVKSLYTKMDVTIITNNRDFQANVDLLVMISKISTDKELFKLFYHELPRDTFIINKRKLSDSTETCALYHVISEQNVGDAILQLAIWRPTKPNPSSVLNIRSQKVLYLLGIGGEYYWPVDDNIIDSECGGMLKIAHVGDLNSLHWVKSRQTSNSGVDIKVSYAGVNIGCVNRLLKPNVCKDDNQISNVIDFSGITKSGARIMGVVQSDSIHSHINANSELLWPVPSHWSLEDAATVPLAYSMAFYILFIKNQLGVNDRICVQGGAGALGQAVIAIALAFGCEVFTAVSNNGKKQFLRKLFPQLKEDHIGYSRDISFADMVLTATKGQGCKIVISCANGDFKDISYKCSGIEGVLYDMTQVQDPTDYRFGMDFLSLERTHHVIDFSCIFQPKYSDNAKYIRSLMCEGITRGYVRPLTRVTFGSQDVARAFRLQASFLNRGRVLLDLRHLSLNVQPRITCSPSAWQILISDNEILTLKLAERLVMLGSKKVVLILNNSSKCVYVQSRLWNDDGVEIKLITDNIWIDTTVSSIIQECEKNGSVESVFIVTTKEKSAEINKLQENVSTTVYNCCNSLKYFALVSTDNVKNDTSPISGFHENNITNIKIPEINMMQDKMVAPDNTLSVNHAINVLERALCLKQTMILAHTCPAPKLSLLEKLIKLADIKKENTPQKISLDTTLKELNIKHSNLLAIEAYLRDVYEVCLKVEDIQLLSVKSINDLEQESTGNDYIEVHGISSYFSNIDTDELLSTTEMMFLPTLTTSSSMRDDELDVTQTYLCIVPGIEGQHSRFRNMCERLKLPALVLQPGLDRPNETVSELANRYAQILLNKTELKGKFYLLGYETGVMVALEMAAILEENGLAGIVFCIGGSPVEIINNIKDNLSVYKTSEQLQHAILKHMYSLMTNENPDLLDSILSKTTDWREKVNACVHTLLGKIPHSIQYAKELIETAYAKLISVYQYTPTPKVLKSQIISLRPRYPTSMDLSLQDYSNQKIISYQLKAPLSCATQDLMCASIINRHLGSDILESFNNRNLCETYLINANIFMASKA